MSSFHQNCPGCGRTLELPIDGKGRLGKCPACEATFTIGETTDAAANPLLDEAASVSQANEPIAHPIEAPADDMPSDRESDDQLLTSPSDLPKTRTLKVTECQIEDVLSITLAIFSARWRWCLGPFAIVAVLTLFVVVLPFAILDEIAKRGAPRLAGVGYMFLLPIVFTFGVIVSVGLARVALAVARNEPAPMSQLISPPMLILRAMGVAFLLSLITGFVILLLFSFVRIVNAAGAKELAVLLRLIAWLASVGLVLVITWQLWAWLLVCADDKGTAIGSIRAAQAIASQNKLTSFFLVLIAVTLALLGTLMCGVGHIVTAPLTILMFAVAYLMMTGQAVSDPRDVAIS